MLMFDVVILISMIHYILLIIFRNFKICDHDNLIRIYLVCMHFLIMYMFLCLHFCVWYKTLLKISLALFVEYRILFIW